MKVIGYDQVSVISPFELKVLQDIQLEWRPGEHGEVRIRGVVEESQPIDPAIRLSTEDTLRVVVQQEGREDTLFHGVIVHAHTVHRHGVCELELAARSGSWLLDRWPRRRSFQDEQMTYEALIRQVLSAYPGGDVIQTEGCERPIQEPIIQYDETDWTFLQRVASHFHSSVLSDIESAEPRIYVGVPERNEQRLPADLPYTASKNVLAYQQAGGEGAGLRATDFFRYNLTCEERLHPGDSVHFRGKSLIIGEMKAGMQRGLLTFQYGLVGRGAVYQPRKTHALLAGASISGEVLATKGERVQLHLEIDEERPGAGYWFPFAPLTGNMMYSMPQPGAQASLYFPDDAGGHARVVGCVRMDGETSEKTANPSNRYFGTEHGSELELTPTAIYVTGGARERLQLSFDEASGVSITSHKKLSLQAAADISLYTPKRIRIRTTNLILAKKLSKLSGFTMENEYHMLGDQIQQWGSDKTTYPPFEDDPATWTPPPVTEEKKKFNWGKLLGNVMAGLAVVAVVTAVAVLTVATLGAGAVVIGAVAAGAAIAGAAGVASMAASDIMRGEVSETRDYAWSGFRDATIGALSGAVFGPMGGLATVGGKMTLGAVTNTYESVLRQGMDGQGFSYKALMLDAGIGAVTGGVMDSRLAKSAGRWLGQGVDRVAPWIRRGLEAAGKKSSHYINQLAEAGSDLGARYRNQLQPAFIDGLPGTGPKKPAFSPELEPTDTQLNYRKIQQEQEGLGGGAKKEGRCSRRYTKEG